jgi:hypothetical protein
MAKTTMSWDQTTKQYSSESGMVIKREQGLTANGNPIGGRWVLRDIQGDMVEVEQYINDLVERHNLTLAADF